MLLTSRPETPIHYGIQTIPKASLDRLVLHEVDPPVVDSDIFVYLSDNLWRVGHQYLGNPNWPGRRTLNLLVKRAGGLFIWAATAYRYISCGKAFANERLQDVLSGVHGASAPTQSLDNIFLTVLDNVACDYHRAEEQSELTSALYNVL